MIQGQEGRRHQQMNEVWNLWRTFAENRRVTCEEISQATGISSTSVFRIFTTDLQKRKNCDRWVPHCLTAEQKQKRLETATLWKQRFNVEGRAFLYRIVTIDETWVRDFEPELKSQSNDWRSPASPRPKKFRRAQSQFKQMMIFGYDHRGIIVTEFHVEQAWQQRIIVTGCRNWAKKYTKTDLTCSGIGHSFCTTMHARTWGRLWPICWVNTSGKCYLTRHTVQTWVHRTSTYFPS